VKGETMENNKNDEFKKLLEQEFWFYGVDNNRFKLGKKVWEAIENPADGYRSYMESIEIVNEKNPGIFFKRPLAKVKVTLSDNIEGYELIDGKSHVWVRFGTDESDDSYPYSVFDYSPKPSDKEI